MRDNSREKAKAKSPRHAHRQPAAHAQSARQKYEHYLALARAKDGNGDRVAAENYYQHAEHYLRSATDPVGLPPARRQ